MLINQLNLRVNIMKVPTIMNTWIDDGVLHLGRKHKRRTAAENGREKRISLQHLRFKICF